MITFLFTKWLLEFQPLFSGVGEPNERETILYTFSTMGVTIKLKELFCAFKQLDNKLKRKK